jgi:hypothetical protein
MVQIEASDIYCDLRGVPDMINPKATQVILKCVLFFVHLLVSSPHTGVMSNSPLGFPTAQDKYLFMTVLMIIFTIDLLPLLLHCVILPNPILLNKRVLLSILHSKLCRKQAEVKKAKIQMFAISDKAKPDRKYKSLKPGGSKA